MRCAVGSRAEKVESMTLIDCPQRRAQGQGLEEADRIRDELAAMGIELKDAKDPKTGELVTTWEVAR